MDYQARQGSGCVPLYLGVDDTDSLHGMCTTYLATELVRALPHVDLIGYPRLVRLNPNIPWKTRGNGAICLRLGRGRGPKFLVGEIEGRAVWAYPRGAAVSSMEYIAEAVARIVEAWAEFDDPRTNPAFVLLRHRPRPGLYWRAVRDVVAKEDALSEIQGLGIAREWKNGRGVIGAAAATAWRPRDRTYEVLAYRHPSRWGSRREIPAEPVRRLGERFPSTFNNYDWEEGRVVITPRTPCPILCGIRGDDPGELPSALASLGGEPPDRWLLFETNQGTDDHVVHHPEVARPWTTVDIEGTVVSHPRTIVGGHVVVPVRWREPLSLVAYEPSKGFRDVVRALSPGDRVRAIGAVRETPRSVNLEKLQVITLASTFAKAGNPHCPSCGKRMKSSGRAGPYRCRRCGVRRPQSDAPPVLRAREIDPGWYEPPVGSRRHLSQPLKRRFSARFDRKGGSRQNAQQGLPQFSRGADSLPTTSPAYLPADIKEDL